MTDGLTDGGMLVCGGRCWLRGDMQARQAVAIAARASKPAA